MTFTTDRLEANLEYHGEILLVLDSDGYDEPIELHKHDTEFDHDSGMVQLELSDGGITFPADAVESVTYHKQSTGDLGL